jgi:hypothetical protein
VSQLLTAQKDYYRAVMPGAALVKAMEKTPGEAAMALIRTWKNTDAE